MNTQTDPYLTLASSIRPRPGFSALDELRHSPRRSIPPLVFDTGVSKAFKDYRRDPGEILAPNAAVGLDERGIACHVWRWRRLDGFLGFVRENREDGAFPRVNVITRGAVVLGIPEVQPGDEGKRVYAIAPDKFSLHGDGEDLPIGFVVYVERDCALPRAVVAFKAFDDPAPIDLPALRSRFRRAQRG